MTFAARHQRKSDRCLKHVPEGEKQSPVIQELTLALRLLGLTSQSTDIARAWLMHCLEVCLVVVWLEAAKCPSRH